LSGDDAILLAPEVHFFRELDRLQLEPPPGLIQQSDEASDREGTLAAEFRDLRRALGGTGIGTNEVAELVLAFSRHRADLEEHLQALDRWRWKTQDSARLSTPFADAIAAAPETDTDTDPAAPPQLSVPALPAAIPREFSLYLRGAQAWHERATNAARSAWESILSLPPAHRRFKSTWAAYMLGRSWHDQDPDRATHYYQATRKLARSGLIDSASLAVASLGWEGQLKLRTNDLGPALRLYLDQYAAGSTQSAGLSLRVAAERVADAPAELRLSVARDPIARRVVTAWLLANTGYDPTDFSPDADLEIASPARNWLKTLETLGAAEVPLAEQLALLNYNRGDWEAAAHWIALSGDSPVADWIQAKLFLREGRLDESAAKFSEALARLPLTPPDRDRTEAPPFIDSLSDPSDAVPARRMVLAESGVLHLSRGAFLQALDALLRAGYWMDAAYAAERVLTLPELRGYVDSHWPSVARKPGSSEPSPNNDPSSLEGQRQRIRHLLGRRLTRSNQGIGATAYYPEEWRTTHQTFITQLGRGEDTTQPPLIRARSWFAAAGIARTNGLEILGTEVAPDWAIWSGQYEYGPNHPERSSSAGKILKPTHSELTRARAHTADPEARFHYRYQAAFLAWDAAQWMPNNDPETAFMIYTAGNWLKSRDPKTADLFYKALVRRCRATELGDAADRQRWFPELDATGKPIVTRAPRTRAIAAPPDPEPFDPTDPDLILDAPEPEEPVNDDTTPDDPALVDPSTSINDAPVALPEP
jgi:tetratricopeptide (TPR) repeat protein